MGTSGASLEHATTIMGKTTDLTVVHIDTLCKEGKPQMDIAERSVCSQSTVSKYIHRKLPGKKKVHKQQGWPQPWEDCQEKQIQELGWASQGVYWSQSHRIKSHHTQTSSGIGLQLSRS